MPLPQRDFFTAQDYWALPEGTRAELIDGELYSMAPPSRKHQEIVSGLVWLLRDYIQRKGGPCKAYVSPFAVNLNADGSIYVEPDVLVVCDSSKLSDRGCEGAPDFVVEVVSPSSVRMDYVKKLNLYLEAGVREYWIVDPDKAMTTVYHFGEEHFAPIICPFNVPVPVGIYQGELKIGIAELLDHD